LQVAIDNVGIPRGLSLDFKNFLSSEALILFMAVSTRGFYILTEDGILSTRESVDEQATRTVTLSFMRNTKLERGKCLILPEVGIVLFVPHNGNYFVSVLYDSESQRSNAFLPTSPRQTGPVTLMASDNADHVAVVSVDGSIVIYWFCNTMICVTSVIAIHRKSVRAVAISKFFGIVVAADSEGGISISRVETGRTIVWQTIPGLAVKKILITKSGFLVFVSETDVQLRDMRLMLIGEEEMRCDAACLVELPGDRRFLAVAQETTVALWRLCPFKLKKATQVPYRIRELIFAETAKKLICIIGSEDEHSRIVIASDLIATG
jgi:WD40 repeat protein